MKPIRAETVDCLRSFSNTIHMYSGITSGRVLNGELLYTKILEVNLFTFADAICPVDWGEISMKQFVGKCIQINF